MRKFTRKIFILSTFILILSLTASFAGCNEELPSQNPTGNDDIEQTDEDTKETGDIEQTNQDTKETDDIEQTDKDTKNQNEENDNMQSNDKNPIVEFTFEGYGVVRCELYPDIAPVSVQNFLTYVNEGFYDGTVMHRVIDGFMIQGGGYYLDGNVIHQKETHDPIVGEFNSNGVQNDLKHTLGVLSMARTSVKNSATSQFFICSATASHLDGEYAAFGKTVDQASNEVVLAIAKAQVVYVSQSFETFPYPPVTLTSVKVFKG